jgi:hypothetical protein
MMGYLRTNLKLRLIFFLVGTFAVLYGLNDIITGEAGSRGRNPTVEESPISYFFTVGKKVIIGGAFAIIALSPLLGGTINNRKEESENDCN